MNFNSNIYSLKKINKIINLKKEKNIIPAFLFLKKYIINIKKNIYSIFLKIFGIHWSILKKIFIFFFLLSIKKKKIKTMFKHFFIIKFLMGYNNIVFIEKQIKFFIIKNLIAILRLKTTVALRLRAGLPVRGQRTKTNAKTSKKKYYFSLIYKKKI